MFFLLNKIVSIHDPRRSHLINKNKWKITKLINSEQVEVVYLYENKIPKFISDFNKLYLPPITLNIRNNTINKISLLISNKKNKLLYEVFSNNYFIKNLLLFLQSYYTTVNIRFLKENNIWVIPNQSRIFYKNINNEWYWNGEINGWDNKFHYFYKFIL